MLDSVRSPDARGAESLPDMHEFSAGTTKGSPQKAAVLHTM
jgi:hypothetical protein